MTSNGRIEDKLTKEEKQEIFAIIHKSFDRDRMEQLFFSALEKNLDDIVPRNVWEVEASDIVKEAMSRGFIGALCDAIADNHSVPEARRKRLKEILAAAAARPDVVAKVNGEDREKGAGGAGGHASGLLGAAFRSLSLQSYRLIFLVIAAYAVILTIIASIPVSTKLKVTKPPEQRVADVNDPDDVKPQYGPPPRPGFSVRYGDYDYAVDKHGNVRINIWPVRYLLAVVSSEIEVDVQYPEGGSTSFAAHMGWSGLSHILLDNAGDEEGAVNGSWEPVGRASASASAWGAFVDSAVAAPSRGGRLYVQSVRPGKGASGDVLDAYLSVGKDQSVLQVLGIDLNTAKQSQLAIVPGAVSVQNYQVFFALREVKIGRDAEIVLESPGFFSSFRERFPLSTPIRLGAPVELTGDRDGRLVVQLLYPVDVVFYERRDTPNDTKKLAPLVAAKGFAPRVNNRSDKVGGGYNVVYAGEDVSIPQLQTVVKVLLQNDIDIRSIQSGLKLKNGVQNQIQVGSGREVLCLPKYSDEQKRKLLGSEADFRAALASQQKDCGQG